MANANLPMQDVPLVPIVLDYYPQITVDVADASVKVIVPFKFRVHRVVVSLRAAAGSTPHTDVDVTVRKNTTVIASLVPIIDASAIAGSGAGIDATLSTVAGALDGAAGDNLNIHLIDITGGSSPTADGLRVTVFVERV